MSVALVPVSGGVVVASIEVGVVEAFALLAVEPVVVVADGVAVAGTPEDETETDVLQVPTCPVGETAVPVKVVSAKIAFEVVEPLMAGETTPTPWSIEKVPAFGADHESTAWSPGATWPGSTTSVQDGASVAAEVTDSGPVVLPAARSRAASWLLVRQIGDESLGPSETQSSLVCTLVATSLSRT